MTHSAPQMPRRTALTAAAWSAPVIALTTPAPAVAASPRPGLQGVVTVRKSCSTTAPGSLLTIDGRGSYPDRGLWVEGATSSTTITSPSITLYFPTALGTIAWQEMNTNSNWSRPVVDTAVPQIANLTAYTMRYSGAFTYSATNAAKIATGQPYFQATISYTACSQSLTTHSLRRVTIDGKLETIQRGPLLL